jgi:hypothetical protein
MEGIPQVSVSLHFLIVNDFYKLVLCFTSLSPVTESAAEKPIFEVSRMTMVAGINGRAMIFN